MITQLLAAVLMQSAVPLLSCSSGGSCLATAPTPDSPAEIEARLNSQRSLEDQIYAPIRRGFSTASCASAHQLAVAALRPDMAYVVDNLCAHAITK